MNTASLADRARRLFLVLLLQSPFALADQSGEPAVQPRQPPIIVIDRMDMPLDELAHNFFFHIASSETLKGMISEEGIERIKPALAEHRREMTDLRKIAPKLRRMCDDLQNAKNGQEFAAVFTAADQTAQSEKMASGRRILSLLDVQDREALERYLDTSFRLGAGAGRLDAEAMFASVPFPSPDSDSMMQKTCDAAIQMEMRVAP